MDEFAIMIGGLMRWVSKGFKTNLSDEINGCFDAKWGKSYELENYIIGLVTTAVLIGVLILLFF